MEPSQDSQMTLTAANFCHNSPLYRWCGLPLTNIGLRADKFHALVDYQDFERGGSPTRRVIAFTPKPGHCTLPLRSTACLEVFRALCRALDHPFLVPTMDVQYIRDRQLLVVCRPFFPDGSVKDYIYNGAQPQLSHGEKYGQSLGRPVGASLGLYGRQVLEALRALRSKGIVFHHLHSRNVLLDGASGGGGGRARLCDVENCLLSLPPPPALHALTLPLQRRGCPVDVAQFGFLLYEMARGFELDSCSLEYVADSCAPDVREVLEYIFDGSDSDSDGSGGDPPSIDGLLEFPLFRNVRVPPPPRLLFSSHMKAIVRSAAKCNAAMLQSTHPGDSGSGSGRSGGSGRGRTASAAATAIPREQRRSRRGLRHRSRSSRGHDSGSSSSGGGGGGGGSVATAEATAASAAGGSQQQATTGNCSGSGSSSGTGSSGGRRVSESGAQPSSLLSSIQGFNKRALTAATQ